MINTFRKQLKTFLALKARKIGFFIVLIFDIYIKYLHLLFFNLLDLDKFIIISSTLSTLLTTLLLLAKNVFKTNSANDLVFFNIKIRCKAILLKL